MPREDTQFKPGKSGNSAGISKEKARLRQAFEEFVTQEGRFDKYLKELDTIATEDKSARARLEAIRILLDKALGKDFHLDLGKDKPEDIKIEIITTHEENTGED